MITYHMKIEEIAEELNKDFNEEIWQKAVQLNFNSKYRRTILKSEKRGIIKFKPHIYTSKRGNKFIVTPFTSGRSHYKKTHSLEFAYIATFHYKNSFFVAWLTSESKLQLPNIYFYPSHFFDRYGERYLKHEFEMTDENLSDFFVRNGAVSMFGKCHHPKYKNHLFATFDEGVMLGERVAWDIMFFKTYITFEMLKGNQVEASSLLKPRLNNIRNNVQEIRRFCSNFMPFVA